MLTREEYRAAGDKVIDEFKKIATKDKDPLTLILFATTFIGAIAAMEIELFGEEKEE
jgi:hypothetical protein